MCQVLKVGPGLPRPAPPRTLRPVYRARVCRRHCCAVRTALSNTIMSKYVGLMHVKSISQCQPSSMHVQQIHMSSCPGAHYCCWSYTSPLSAHGIGCTQACYDGAMALQAYGKGVQLQRKECFTQACRAVFPGSDLLHDDVQQAFM